MKTFQGDKVTLKAGETKTVKASATLHNLDFWSWGYGYLYTVKTALKDDNNQVFDEVSTAPASARHVLPKERYG